MSKAFKTIEQQILSQLRTDIHSGIYRPGEKLRQDEVARRFEVSTTPVREAFRGLRSEGLVHIDANKGVTVKSLTIDDVVEIYELCITLQPLLARKSVAMIDANILTQAQALLEAMAITESPAIWASLNNEFHLKLMSNQSHSRLFEIVKNLLITAVPYVSLSLLMHPQIRHASSLDQSNILDAYRKSNYKLVEKSVRQHLQSTLETIRDCVSKQASAILETPQRKT